MELSADDQLFLRTACDYFHNRAKWPTYDYLDRILGDSPGNLDVRQIGRKLEPFMYEGFYRPLTVWEPEREVSLGISALHTCMTEGIYPDVAEDLDALMQVISLCLEKYRARDLEDPGVAQITSQDLHERFGMPDLMLRKVLILASMAGITYGSTGSDSGQGQLVQWSFGVSSHIRDFRQVTTIEEFLQARELAQQEAHPSNKPNAGATIDLHQADPRPRGGSAPSNVTSGAQLNPISLFPAGPFTRNERSCFVIMPFASELNAVYDEAIIGAATKAGLECKRADEIMKPGGIMAQVWQALVEARVIIADLTGQNANVFYELGLAHAIGLDVILLTQDMRWVPFDLRHMRCQVYEANAHGLQLLEQNLRLAIQELLADAPEVSE